MCVCGELVFGIFVVLISWFCWGFLVTQTLKQNYFHCAKDYNRHLHKGKKLKFSFVLIHEKMVTKWLQSEFIPY